MVERAAFSSAEKSATMASIVGAAPAEDLSSEIDPPMPRWFYGRTRRAMALRMWTCGTALLACVFAGLLCAEPTPAAEAEAEALRGRADDSAVAPTAARHPRALWLDEAAGLLFVLNEQSGTLSAVRLETGEVDAEISLGGRTRPQAISGVGGPHGIDTLAIACTFTHEVVLVDVVSGDTGNLRLVLRDRARVGRLPVDLLYSDERERLFVACETGAGVWVLDIGSPGASPPSQRSVRIDGVVSTIDGPRRLAVLEGRGGTGDALVVAGRDRIAGYDLAGGEELWTRIPADGRAFNLDGLATAKGKVFLAHQVRSTDMAISPQTIVWGLIIINRITVIDPAGPPDVEEVTSLDFRHRAAGDPADLVLLPPDRSAKTRALVASAGTDRVLLVDVEPRAFDAYASPLDRDAPLRETRPGRRPVAFALTNDGRTAYVACWLDDEVREIDLKSMSTKRRFRLAELTDVARAERVGASIFYSSRRSRGGWYSCHSCHPDGGSRGHSFDTSADGDGFAKRAPDLRAGVVATGPWAWNGSFERLGEQVAASLHQTMAVDDPAPAEDVAQVVRFLSMLERPLARVPEENLGGDVERGRRLFERSGCASCHAPGQYTSSSLEDVGVVDLDTGRRRFNPPSLLGVRDRHRYLHDGRASSLRSVFREHNREERHGKAHELTDGELDDLIAFLRSL